MKLLHPDTPFAPRRAPFFYGWVVLAASTVGVLMSIPGQTMGVSVFTDSLIGATGLSRLSLSNAYLAGTISSGLLLPRGGRLLDRFGARPTVLLAAFGLGATLLALSAIDRLVGPIVVTWLALAVAFTALRFTGQGMLTMVSRMMLGKWFDRRRGLASGISGVFVAFGFASAPLLLDAWIGAAGWRGAWASMAAVVGFGMGGFGWLLFRDNPEECGLRMDGASPAHDVAPEVASTRDEAVRTGAFWALTLALAVHGLVVTGFTFQIVDVGAEHGLLRAEAVSLFLPIAVFSTVTGALVGWAADRVRIRSLIFVLLAAEIVGYTGASQLGTAWGMPMAIVGLGIASGFFGPLSAVALPRLFGRTHLGAIAGVESMALVIGSALGPSAFAASRSLTGSYTPGLLACVALPVLVLLLNYRARHPKDVPPLGAPRR